MYRVFVVSDGTGGTAERALKAALLQFEGEKIETVCRSGIRSKLQVQDVVKEAARAGGFIVHILFTNKLRQEMIHTRRIFGLKSDPFRLAALRHVRQERLSGATGNYANPHFVAKEMDFALNIFNKNPKWRLIDVTSKPIEEIASEIIALVGKNQ
jgi:regulator of PEP synthase PpsR (kinase-PPPase family)